MACTFQATIGGQFAPLVGLRDEDMDINTMITTYNTVTDAASEILSKERRRKKLWVTKDISTSVMYDGPNDPLFISILLHNSEF